MVVVAPQGVPADERRARVSWPDTELTPRQMTHLCAMTFVNAYEMSRLLTMARALRTSHRHNKNETMMQAKKIHLPICAPVERGQHARQPPDQRRRYLEGDEEQVPVRTVVFGRLSLEDLAGPSVRCE